MKLSFIVLIFFVDLTSIHASDSLRTETINGKQVIVYRVEKGQTLFAISRKYSISVNEIKKLNPELSQLKIGSEIYLPTKKASLLTPNVEKIVGTDESNDQTIHVVKRGETLYKISKLYNISVAYIRKANDLEGDLYVGQELVISQKEIVTNKKQTSSSKALVSAPTEPINVTPKSEKKINSSGYPAMTESGIAKFDEILNNEPAFYVQHKSAAIGTLVLVKNKENGNSVHAKVVANTNADEPSIIVVNKRVYDKLEPKANTFAVELFYTPEQ